MGSEGQVWQTLQQYREADDLHLAERAAAGETLARRALLDRYLPLIYSVCVRSGLNRTDAQDVSQECVIKLLRFLPQYRGEAKLSTWIYTLCKRAVADYYRASVRREETVDWSDPINESRGQDAPHQDSRSGSGRNDDQHDANRMTQWIDELGEPVRSVMLRFYLADETVTEIADAMQLPEGTIKTHLFRGRQLLRQRLEPTS